MNLAIDERNDLMTSSRVRECGAEPETKRLYKNDWWYVGTASKSQDSSTKESSANPQTGNTEANRLTNKLRPVRKDSGIITLNGDRKVLLQQWECVVIERQEDAVCCELHDLTNELNPPEYAEVLLAEFNTWDLPLLVEGAVFYWSLGRLIRQTGQVLRFSEFIVRRIPKLSQLQRREISRKVEKLNGILLRK